MKNLPAKINDSKVIALRGTLVVLDRDLAAFFGVGTKALNQAVKRNNGRFPEEFMFQLTREELDELKSQSGALEFERLGRRNLPYAFTEMGCWTVSMILKSKRAEKVGKELIRTFKTMRDFLRESSGQLPSNINKLLSAPNTTINLFHSGTGPVNILVGQTNILEQKFNDTAEMVEFFTKVQSSLGGNKELSDQLKLLVKAIEKKDKTQLKDVVSTISSAASIVTSVDPVITALKTGLSALMKFFVL